jgi:tetratricopeptide (TPR) repeat protein
MRFIYSIFIIILIFHTFSIKIFSQDIKIDSLIKECEKEINDKNKIILLLQIAKYYEIPEPQKSLIYAQKSLNLALEIDFDSAEVRSLILIGSNLCRLNRLNEAIEIGEQIVKRAEKEDMQLEIADGRTIMAVAYASGGDFDNSSKLYFENLKLFEKLDEKYLIASTLGNIATDFIELQNYDKALEYLNRSLEIGMEINNNVIIADQYTNLAALYYTGYHDLEKSIDYFNKSIILAEKIDDPYLQALNLLNIGHLYSEMNYIDSSMFYIFKSINLFPQYNNSVLLADCYIALSNNYISQNNINLSKDYALKGYQIGNDFQNIQTIYNAANLLQKISFMESDSLSAYKFMEIKFNAQDSLYFMQNQNELFKLEFQYNQDKSIKEQKIKQLKMLLVFGFIVISLISGLIISFLIHSRQKIRIKNILLEKEKTDADFKYKSKELSLNLISLLKKNELISEIINNLNELEKIKSYEEINRSVKRLNQNIKHHFDDKLIQEFSTQFKESNIDFYNKLIEKFPSLTKSELKLCAYLRLNMSTKEIITLTGQSSETLDKARYRLRKKLGLTNVNTNLNLFLMQF